MFATLQRWLNRLLPFATPGTPLVQDVVHLAVICVALYYAPQIQRLCQQQLNGNRVEGPAQGAPGEALGRDQAHPYDDQPHERQDEVNVNDFRPVVAQEGRDHDLQLAQDEPPHVNDDFNDGLAGPADPQNHLQADRQAPQSRQVGAKKAKSLARRDQRRAYHEFMRSQGEAERARDAEGAAEREAEMAAQRQRRAEAEAAIVAREATVRTERRDKERREREAEARRRDEAVAFVRKQVDHTGLVRLANVADTVGGGVDAAWAERLVKASGLLGEKGDGMIMLTNSGWVVKIAPEQMEQCYRLALSREDLADEHGRVSFEHFGRLLEEIVRQDRQVVA